MTETNRCRKEFKKLGWKRVSLKKHEKWYNPENPNEYTLLSNSTKIGHRGVNGTMKFINQIRRNCRVQDGIY